MAKSIDPFTTIDNGIMEPLKKVMGNSITHLSTSLGGPLKVSCTLYIIFIGYNVIYGRSSMPLWDFIATTFKLGIIVALTTNAAHYNTWVTNIFFSDLPNAIANVTQGAHSDKNVWDNLLQNAAAHAFDAASNTPGRKIGTFIANWIAGCICYVVAIIVCTIGFIVSMLAKLGLFLVISVGPLFISLYMFSSTRRFTEAWLNQTANFIILQVLVVLLGGLYIKIATNIFSGDMEDILFSLLNFMAVGICGIYLFFHLPGIASALASGGASLTGATKLGADSAKTAWEGAQKLETFMEKIAKKMFGKG